MSIHCVCSNKCLGESIIHPTESSLAAIHLTDVTPAPLTPTPGRCWSGCSPSGRRVGPGCGPPRPPPSSAATPFTTWKGVPLFGVGGGLPLQVPKATCGKCQIENKIKSEKSPGILRQGHM